MVCEVRRKSQAEDEDDDDDDGDKAFFFFSSSGTQMRSLPPLFLSSSHNSLHSRSPHFNTLDDALSSFNRMLHMHPPPSTVDFTKF
ncbi:hypothetical protein CK203_058841 [Vitis vinifera]|uniref:Uncharacterized protein n=1 Tax=Vitis vinifera TaxID=29760 RepID=A0A438G8R4_VITVI|nr:hypothetical protein CK203_058841 [Vitis vinifera]